MTGSRNTRIWRRRWWMPHSLPALHDLSNSLTIIIKFILLDIDGYVQRIRVCAYHNWLVRHLEFSVGGCRLNQWSTLNLTLPSKFLHYIALHWLCQVEPDCWGLQFWLLYCTFFRSLFKSDTSVVSSLTTRPLRLSAMTSCWPATSLISFTTEANASDHVKLQEIT